MNITGFPYVKMPTNKGHSKLPMKCNSAVKNAKIDDLNRKNELFRMKGGETLQDTHARYTTNLNEIYSLGELIPTGKVVREHLSMLPESWKVRCKPSQKLETLTPQ